MNGERLTSSDASPARSTRVIATICALQVALLVLPLPVAGQAAIALGVLGLVSALILASSVPSAVLFLVFVSTVIPGYISEEYLLLPMDFKFAEGLFMAVLFLALLNALKDGVQLPRTPLNRPMTVFLAVVVLSCGVGLYLGQSTSQMLRDVRYPLYYGMFFVVTAFFRQDRQAGYFYLVILIASIIGVEYLVEFMASVNLSISGQFHRIARTEGLLLPIGTLLIGAAWMYAPGRNVRLVGGIALIPVAVAFILTVGRGMWFSAAVGFASLAFLFWRDPRRVGLRSAWVIVAVPLLVFGAGSTFETVTDTGIGSAAARRIERIQDYEDDNSISSRLISYQIALGKIAGRPILGGGHGATVSFPVMTTEIPHIATLGMVDNVYLTILLRMGLVGLAAFLWLYLKGLRTAYRLFRTSDDEATRFFAAGFVAVYSAMLVYGVADATLIGTRLIFIHAVSLGILARLASEERS